ncbi:MAG TPA: endonuclease/exonuclease/phosphatase family protein [Acetobacteraceae bacterium]|nr:endonuclease/exonuclease/phosphatase family protein [Acetobacteraceae bacterium]
MQPNSVTPSWKAATLAFAVAACLLLPVVAFAAELKVATWNLNWLTQRPAGDPSLPADVHVRGPADFDRLRHYAKQLDADVIAIQEVDGRDVAARLFPPDRYSIYMTHDHVVQRVGIVVRRGLDYDVNPDVTALDLGPGRWLRSGADITLHLPAGPLRMLAVHLKTGCNNASLTRTRTHSCTELRAQIRPLRAWIAARQQEGVPFIVLGDFNRHMDGRDQLWAALARTAPLVRATQGRSSPCWGGEAFIDHIIAGGAARDWMQLPTLRVLTYRESGDDWKDRLSDHCPVSVEFLVPR